MAASDLPPRGHDSYDDVNRMPFAGVADAAERGEIVRYLATLK